MGDDARGCVTEATNHYSLAVWRGLTCFGNKLLSPLPPPNAAKFPINEQDRAILATRVGSGRG